MIDVVRFKNTKEEKFYKILRALTPILKDERKSKGIKRILFREKEKAYGHNIWDGEIYFLSNEIFEEFSRRYIGRKGIRRVE